MTTLVVKDTDVPGSCDYIVSFTDAKGKPAKVDGIPTVTASDPAIVDSIGAGTDNGDGTFTYKLHITDSIGASNLTVDGDADLGAGVTDVQFVDVVSVMAGDAVAGTGSFGAVIHD